MFAAVAVIAMLFLGHHNEIGISVGRPSFSGHWVIDAQMTRERRVRARQNPAEAGGATPLGKELTITQDARAITVTTFLGGRTVTMVYRFDGSETRNRTVGRDAPIEERSTAKWDGDVLLVRTSRKVLRGGVSLPSFLRKWSIEGDVLVIATSETNRAPVETCFRRSSRRP